MEDEVKQEAPKRTRRVANLVGVEIVGDDLKVIIPSTAGITTMKEMEKEYLKRDLVGTRLEVFSYNGSFVEFEKQEVVKKKSI